jgi:hypothetical protein
MATCMLSGESANTNFIVFGLTQPELKLTIYCILGEHVNHYTTEVALGKHPDLSTLRGLFSPSG